MKVLVAGGTGALGRPLLAQLVAAGHDVYAATRRSSADDVVRAAGAMPVRLDVFDGAATREAATGTDAVINVLTRIPAPPGALLAKAWRDNDRLRSVASNVLADAAIATGARFVQESFAATYAAGGDALIVEDHPLAPVGQTRTVLDAEAAAARVTATGLPGIVLRFGLFYGPSAASTADSIDAARKGRLLLPGPLDRFASMVWLQDAAAAVLHALDAPAGTYNVAEAEPLRLTDHAAALAAAVGVERVRPLPAALGRIPNLEAISRSIRLDTRRLQDATGWRATVPSVREGWPLAVEASRADA